MSVDPLDEPSSIYWVWPSSPDDPPEANRALADIPVPKEFPLSDPAWRVEFHRLIKILRSTERDMSHCSEMPTYRAKLLKTQWHPTLERLQRHLYALDRFLGGRPAIKVEDLASGGICHACRMAREMVNEIIRRFEATGNPNASLAEPLARIDELLDTIHNSDSNSELLVLYCEAVEALQQAPVNSPSPAISGDDILVAMQGMEERLKKTRTPEGGKKSPKPTRKKGSATEQCVGIYLGAIANGKEPPSASELAELVKCDRTTAYRAIKPYEDNRREKAKRDAWDRHTDRSAPKSIRNK